MDLQLTGKTALITGG